MSKNQEVYSYRTNLHKYIIKPAVYKAPDKSRFDNLGRHNQSSRSFYLREINNLLHGYRIVSKYGSGFFGNHYLVNNSFGTNKREAKLSVYRNGRIVSEFLSEKTNDQESYQTTEVRYYMNGYLLTYNFSKLDNEKLNVDHRDFDNFEEFRIGDYEFDYRKTEYITFKIDGIKRYVSKLDIKIDDQFRYYNRDKYAYKFIDFYNDKNKKHGLSLTWCRIDPYKKCQYCHKNQFYYCESRCECIDYEKKSKQYIYDIDTKFQYHKECEMRAEHKIELIKQIKDSEFDNRYQRELINKLKNYSNKHMTFDLSVFYPINKKIADQHGTKYRYKIIKEIEYKNDKRCGIWREHEYELLYFTPPYKLMLTTKYKKDLQHGINLTYRSTTTTPKYHKHFYYLQIYIHGVPFGRRRLVMKKQKNNND
jgi:hypothetical protein